MSIKSISVSLLALVLVALPTADAKALTNTEALTRMDQIIKEMLALRLEFASLLGSTNSTSKPGQVLGAATTKYLIDEVVYGATNDSIRRVQKLLATDSEIYPDGTVSGFFGPKTQDAIRRFQARFGLDTVGVVGPSTKNILEAFMAAYPSENYPAGVLTKGVPQVKGESTTVVPPLTTAPTVTTPSRTFRNISVEKDYNEYLVRASYSDGSRFGDFVVIPDDEDELYTMIAKKLSISEQSVRDLVDADDIQDSNGDKEKAEEALADAEEALADAKDEVDEALDDDEDVGDAEDLLDEAEDLLADAEEALDDEDYDEVLDLTDEISDLVEEALDEL